MKEHQTAKSQPVGVINMSGEQEGSERKRFDVEPRIGREDGKTETRRDRKQKRRRSSQQKTAKGESLEGCNMKNKIERTRRAAVKTIT
jgi:hypothetical protein